MPESLVGIATGDLSCILAVHVHGRPGLRSLASLELPLTWQARVADSVIYYFRQPDHLIMPEGFLHGRYGALPGIDIHATNSTVILPPSNYPSGEPLTWVTPKAVL